LLAHHFHEEEAQHLSIAWREHLGVDIRCEVIPWDGFLEQIRAARPHTFISSWMADYPDPDNYLRMPLALYSSWNHGTYWQLIEQARQAADQGARLELYAQAELILVEEVPILPLSYWRMHHLVKPWVKKYPLSPMYNYFWKDVVIEPR
jgi:oligopeptide transport system substrate-binding protein